jgi:hypothetical protein
MTPRLLGFDETNALLGLEERVRRLEPERER